MYPKIEGKTAHEQAGKDTKEDKNKVTQLTIIGWSAQKRSKQNDPGGLYPLGSRPVNNQLCRSIIFSFQINVERYF